LGIDLVPNQNSFGHLRYFLADQRLKKLAEIPEPYEAETGDFLRRPSTLAPNHPGTLPFLRQLYDELLPNFSSRFFNVGGDETWDLGKGRSRELCRRRGQGRVYVDFLKELRREVSQRGRTMMFWGDIILKHPELIGELAGKSVPDRKRAESETRAPDMVALNWGYGPSIRLGRRQRNSPGREFRFTCVRALRPGKRWWAGTITRWRICARRPGPASGMARGDF
jgi:hypothetical protein